MPTARRGAVVSVASLVTAVGLALSCSDAAAQGGVTWRCPNNLYTDALSAKEAADKGCKALEGAPITVIQGPAVRPRGAGAAAPAGSASRPADSRVDPMEQRVRDSESRRILESELRKEQERLGEMQKEYNGGEPERRGDERNYQKYLDRTAELKLGIARKEADITAIRRELAKVSP